MTRKGHKKGIPRQVISLKKLGRTQQGNPKTYYFLLDCGHMRAESHRIRWKLVEFQLETSKVDDSMPTPTLPCHKCRRGEPIEGWIMDNLFVEAGHWINHVELFKKVYEKWSEEQETKRGE